MGEHWLWLGLLGVIATLVLGPNGLSELTAAIGRSVRELRIGLREGHSSGEDQGG